jgi:hypothetical protein
MIRVNLIETVPELPRSRKLMNFIRYCLTVHWSDL